jgi:hypothetical protein
MIPELQLLGLAGLLIHALKDWVSHNKEGRAYPIAKSFPAYLLSAVTTSVLIYLADDIKTMYVITPFSALVLGYLGNSVFFSFIKAKEKDVADLPPEPIKEPVAKTETLDDGSKPPEEERPDKP